MYLDAIIVQNYSEVYKEINNSRLPAVPTAEQGPLNSNYNICCRRIRGRREGGVGGGVTHTASASLAAPLGSLRCQCWQRAAPRRTDWCWAASPGSAPCPGCRPSSPRSAPCTIGSYDSWCQTSAAPVHTQKHVRQSWITSFLFAAESAGRAMTDKKGSRRIGY